MIVLTAANLGPEHLAVLTGSAPGVEIRVRRSATAYEAELPEAEVIFGALRAGQAARAPRLRWVQVPNNGVDNLPLQEIATHGIQLTNCGVLNADAVAEHALAMMLAHTRALPRYLAAQSRVEWDGPEGLSTWVGRQLLIAGYGRIGHALARRAVACGMRVWAVRLHPDGRGAAAGTGSPADPAVATAALAAATPADLAERVLGPDELLGALPACDAVACCLPGTPLTRGFFGAAAFAAIKPGAFFVNVARGGTCDTAALWEALRSGRLSGAGLDVFETEPLPPDHPLWRHPGVIITPHVGGHAEGRLPEVMRLFAANLARYARGEPLQHVVNPAHGY